MNKTTIKISVLAFLGFMTYGYAQQQDLYKGKVGVNTTEPSATMDVQPNSDNARVEAKTNEGIIAPKLSKTRIANIETPVEGTLVYATDDATSLISAYTGSDPKVAKITEKGYYYYNGTEWVKAGNEVTQQIWQKQTNKDILLVDNDIQNIVKYTEQGYYQNFPKDSRNYIDDNTFNNRGKVEISFADKINYQMINPEYKFKTGYYNGFIIDNESDNSIADRLINQSSFTDVKDSSTKNFVQIYTKDNHTSFRGTGKVNQLMATYNTARMHSGAAKHVIGSRNEANIYTVGDVEKVEGASNRTSINTSGKVDDVYGVTNQIVLGYRRTPTIRNVVANNNLIDVAWEFRGNVDNLIGGLYNIIIPDYGEARSMYGIKIGEMKRGKENNYGLYISDVGRGIAQNNFAIHTGAGNIRFGDLKHTNNNNTASTGDRPVFVTADGVLKVGDASTALARAVWTPDSSSNSVKLAITSANGDRTTHPISITDEGMVRATSFQGVNGATIFPDYVFQKYYTGTSSIKADYNFKSLSQVEDFVKTNGHLPGYKSAETIKAQGYIDLMETQLTNVEKIEELYLHLMEKEKEVKQLKEELKAQKEAFESRLQKLEKLIQ